MKNLYVKMSILVMLIAILGMGCIPGHLTPKEKVVFTTFKTLQTAKQFRNTGLEVAGKLHSEGIVTDKVARKLIVVGNDLQAAINATAIVLKAYHQSGNPNDKDDLRVKIQIYEQVYGQFSDLIMPYLIERIGD